MRFVRIRHLRREHNLTLQEVADILHCNREVYRRYEKGTNEIPIWALIELAKYYNCTLEYITGRIDTREPFGT